MPPLYEQRAVLIDETTKLVLVWLSLLGDEGRYNVIRSMMHRYSLPKLKDARQHVEAEIARLQKKAQP